MPRGVCRTKNGWGTEDSVVVEYDDGTTLEMPLSQYIQQGYDPPADTLPPCTGDQS